MKTNYEWEAQKNSRENQPARTCFIRANNIQYTTFSVQETRWPRRR